MRQATRKVDGILKYILTRDIMESRDLIRSASVLVGETVGWKVNKEKVRKEPWWKHRIEGDIKALLKDLSRLEE